MSMPTASAASGERCATASGSERIWQVLADIPVGRVATYGQVAELAGFPGGARRVGRALAGLPADTRLPWQRVVLASGASALPGAAGERQLARLRAEGVALVDDRRVDLAHCRWRPGHGGATDGDDR